MVCFLKSISLQCCGTSTDGQPDEYLAQRLAGMTDTNSYTILFMSTPGEPNYEAEFEDSVQMDFKRDVQGQTVRRNDNETDWNRLPLFEKYQFFTPGRPTLRDAVARHVEANKLPRNLHGNYCRPCFVLHPWCRYQGIGESRGFLWRV